MRRLILAIVICSLAGKQAAAAPKWVKATVKILEHAAIGAGTEIAVSQAAGGSQKWGAGLLAAGTVAGFKEGSDALCGADTKKKAIEHALTIVAGAGIAIAIKH